MLGYGSGEHAPGRSCRPATEVYRAAHTLLLAHAHAVACYRTQFQGTHGGLIAVTLNCDWRQPKEITCASDVAAAERSLAFHLGWFADPFYHGDYPSVMRERCGDRLPVFTSIEKMLLLGSNDYFGLNHYGTALVEDCPEEFSSGGGTVTSIWGKENSGGFWANEHVQYSNDPSWKKTDMVRVGWNIGFFDFLILSFLCTRDGTSYLLAFENCWCIFMNDMLLQAVSS